MAKKHYMEIYEKWIKKEDLDPEIKKELEEIAGHEEEIEERFYQVIEFGTAGLRGMLGAGTNRMNIYTVRRAAQGFAQAINKNIQGPKSVVFARDSRRMSKEFAEESAKIFASNGIKVYLFTEVTPTPLLSYAVRLLGCSGGVMITASHNPKNYNGYKVYWDDGAQVTEEKASMIIEEVSKVEDYLDLETESFDHYVDQGLISFVHDEVYEKYYEEIRQLKYMKDGEKEISILFSAFFGTAREAIGRVMEDFSFKNYRLLEEQSMPNSEFPDLEYPNPEDPTTFKLLLERAQEEPAELLMATDPDGDRIGCQVLHQGEYVVLTGNQMGVLMVDYLVNQPELPEKSYIIKTVVTMDLAAKIAEKKGVKTYEVLTGFKYVAELAKKLMDKGEYYVFGYEESYGYMPRLFVRDKDGVQALVLLAQIADDLKKEGKTLIDRLDELHKEFGFYKEINISRNYEGLAGKEKINSILSKLRADFVKQEDMPLVKMQDFKYSVEKDLKTGETKELDLPESNVLKFFLEDGSWIAIRPSGTEPKIKYYFAILGKDEEEAEKKAADLSEKFFKNL